MRLQLIRYESVELTEQLMRERNGEDGEEEEEEDDDDDDEEDEEDDKEVEDTGAQAEPPGLGKRAVEAGGPLDMEGQLQGVLLEEGGPEVGLEAVGGEDEDEDEEEQGMFYVLTGGLTQEGEDAVMLQLQDTASQLGMHVV